MAKNNEKPKMTAHDRAEMIIKMTKQADRATRTLGAEASILICVFKDGNQLVIQDAGKYPMPPEQLYEAMQHAHANGQMDLKPKSRILRPN